MTEDDDDEDFISGPYPKQYGGENPTYTWQIKQEHEGPKQPNRLGTIKAGSLFLITSGSYSDYQVQGVVKAVRDIDLDKLREEYLGDSPDARRPHGFKAHRFIAWLAAHGYFIDVECAELHVGDFTENAYDMTTKGVILNTDKDWTG